MKKAITIIVLIIGFVWFVWEWGFCRFYVAPNEMAVIITKLGKELPPDKLLAGPDEQGIQAAVLGEGRHFRNPVVTDWEIKPVIVIPPGSFGVVESKGGRNLKPGEFMANDDEKGVWRRVLGPGKYRINPYGYTVRIEKALSIPIGYAGVVTSLSGEQAPDGAFATNGQKGVREDIMHPGLYYANPRQYRVSVLEIGVNQVSLLGREGGAVITKARIETGNKAMNELQDMALQQQAESRKEYYTDAANQGANAPAAGWNREAQSARPAQEKKQVAKPRQTQDSSAVAQILNQVVEFPSRDGFEISVDMTVEFELLPDKIAWLYLRYGDLPAVVDNIIMPQILSITRNKGSEYQAKDFIVGDAREKFQKETTDALAKTLAEKKIIIHNALIRSVNVPDQILDPIRRAGLAGEQDLTNQERQNTARKMAELNTEVSLIEQRREQVAQETSKLTAEIGADQKKKVAEIHAEATRQCADIEKQTAEIKAAKTRIMGQAVADSVRMVEGEKANGHQMKAEAFGDPVAYSLWEFAGNLKPDIKINILHAGSGTLWTDLDKARLGDLGGAKVMQQPLAPLSQPAATPKK